jgi:histidine triad (HIT) family protein
MTHDCVFCKIIKKEIPADIVYEDRNSLAFLDINPVSSGHVLVVTKKHFKNIYDTPDEIVGEAAKLAKKISHVVKTAMRADGVNITMNNDEAAGQKIFHAHIHVIPRFADDGLEMWHSQTYALGEKEAVAKKIIQAL